MQTSIQGDRGYPRCPQKGQQRANLPGSRGLDAEGVESSVAAKDFGILQVYAIVYVDDTTVCREFCISKASALSRSSELLINAFGTSTSETKQEDDRQRAITQSLFLEIVSFWTLSF
jgi:hypothetical protein